MVVEEGRGGCELLVDMCRTATRAQERPPERGRPDGGESSSREGSERAAGAGRRTGSAGGARERQSRPVAWNPRTRSSRSSWIKTLTSRTRSVRGWVEKEPCSSRVGADDGRESKWWVSAQRTVRASLQNSRPTATSTGFENAAYSYENRGREGERERE
jgi:hypothetical protein